MPIPDLHTKLFKGLRGKASRHQCNYCDQRAQTWDHVNPKANGGQDTFDNVVPACYNCNQLKRDMSVEQFRKVLAARRRNAARARKSHG